MTLKKIMTYRNEIYGIAAIWIILFHVCVYTNTYVSYDEGGILSGLLKILLEIFRRGNAGIDIFLLLSPIGLYRSFHENPLLRFYERRINRVVIPYLLVAVFYFLWYDLCLNDNGVGGYLLNLTTAQLWITGKYPLWYASFIAIMYLLYPLLYKIDRTTRHIGIISIILVWVCLTYFAWKYQVAFYLNCERAINRLPIFLLGIMISPYFYGKNDIEIGSIPVITSGIYIVFFGVLVNFMNITITDFLFRYLLGMLGISVIIIWTEIRSKNVLGHLALPLRSIGCITFETYLIHVIIKEIIDVNHLWQLLPVWSWYLIVFCLTVPAAVLLHNCVEILKIK